MFQGYTEAAKLSIFWSKCMAQQLGLDPQEPSNELAEQIALR
jgi:hypothetical protein